MKAIAHDRYGPLDVLELRDVQQPTPRADQVLVRVHAASIDPGVWHVTTGTPYPVRLVTGLRAPKIPIRGMDVSGVVEAVGADVTRFRPGDAVYGTCDGSFAEYACAEEDRLALKPANLDLEQAAAVPVSACTALQGLRDSGRLRGGQKVLILGAGGGVGTFAVQLAKSFGADVTGVCSTSKTELVRSLGADSVIDYTTEDFTDGTRRYDLVLDIAGARPLAQLRRTLTPRGTLVMVGGEAGGRWMGGLDRQLRALARSLVVGQTFRMLVSRQRHDDLRLLAELIEAGKLRPVIDRTYPLADVPAAVRYVQEGHARGKVAIAVATPQGSGERVDST